MPCATLKDQDKRTKDASSQTSAAVTWGWMHLNDERGTNNAADGSIRKQIEQFVLNVDLHYRN